MFLSGCYYFDRNELKWSSNGVEVLEETNETHTVCESDHLTEFAGGFIVLPNPIDFNYVFANASFTRNPIIYSTVIFLTCLYILLAIICVYADKHDEKKTQINVLKDNKSKQN